MNATMAEAIPIVLLAAVLAFAVVRPHGWPEAIAAVPAAGLLVAIGAVSYAQAYAEVTRLSPVIGFLAAVLVLARLCNDAGLFTAAGAAMARACSGRPGALLPAVFVVASIVTAVLSLDATAVLLTPVVFATAARVGARPRPHVYACAHLANSASVLLPVSNLTNLLAFAASGLSFARFTALMAAPWLAAIAVEYAIARRFFAADLAVSVRSSRSAERPSAPVFALVVVAFTLSGFVATSFAGINPAWAALAGVVVLAAREMARRRTTLRDLAAATNPPFLIFVLALGIVVQAVVNTGLTTVVEHLLPGDASLPALLAIACVAAVLANTLNNLPAVLALLPVVSIGGPGPVLATLIGVNVGPNLTYAGSLATLLWRRVLREHEFEPELGEFLRLGALTVPATLGAAVLALWLTLQTIGV